MSLSEQRQLLDVYDALDAMHAWRGWHWWPDGDPFEVAVGAILVQHTTWVSVEIALDRLRDAGVLSFDAMTAAEDATLAEAIRPTGTFNVKLRRLRAFLELCAAHGGVEGLFALPADCLRERLLATHGIGKETADAIVLYSARQLAFVVDAYTQRIFGRLALGPASAVYDHWQRYFVERLPCDRDLWARYHALIVLHAKHLCRARAPRCGDCSLADHCTYPRETTRA